MNDTLKEILHAVYRFVSNRVLLLFVLLAVLFYMLLAYLFSLQIAQPSFVRPVQARTREVEVSVPALRGSIFDRKGRPLAVNNIVYVVKFNPSVLITNEALLELEKLFVKHGEDYVDDFPMTAEEPYEFTYQDNAWREWRENRWKDDMAVPNYEEATAQETFEYLRDYFYIDPELSSADARKILNFRCMIFMERMIFMDDYEPSPITLAYDVKPETVAVIEEQNALYTGVYIEIYALREYPQGKYFSHMLGYTGKINEQEFERLKDRGYSNQEIIGKTGLERSMENYLRGESGAQVFEVNTAGRRINTVAEIAPEPGGNIFLTVDAELQRKAYDVLEDYLARIIAAKITLQHQREDPITLRQIFVSLIKSGNLDIVKIMEAERDTDARIIADYVNERLPGSDARSQEDIAAMRELLAEAADAGRISISTILLAMVEVGQLTDTDGLFVARLKAKSLTERQAVIDKILSKELSPQMMNMDPSTGSVVIVDTRNGDVLAAAGYPSYDNNRFANNFDNDYYRKISGDPLYPLSNRPFMEPRAPGSTFKMVTMAAALEAGSVGLSERVYDELSFQRAGEPYLRCYSSVSHGSINIVTALQVSCNYFFCEAAYRLGSVRGARTTLEGIQTLNDYMVFFGLNEKTGVEIGEHLNSFDNTDLSYKISSPEFKRHRVLEFNPFASAIQLGWYDGDTVQTAIGQSFNWYTPASMAKYVTVIANRGVKYPLHLVNEIRSVFGESVFKYEAVPELQQFTISDSTWNAIIEGMRLVTERGGTAQNYFDDYPIKIASKTGTAQEAINARNPRPDHSSFAAFAPIEDPKVAIYVNIPFGSSNALTHISAQIVHNLLAEVLEFHIEPEHPEPADVLRR